MGFLEAEYSFRELDTRVIDDGTQSMLGTVTYAEPVSQNPPRFVRLSVAPIRLELDLDVGIGTDRREYYAIYELHQLEVGGEFPGRQHDLLKAIHNREQLLHEFNRLTAVLRSCGSRFFAGDISLWEDLKRQRSAKAQAANDQQASLDAEAAFKAQRWQDVVNLLEDRESRLSKLDSSRLRYARKQLARVS